MKEVQLIGDEIKSIEQRLNDSNERFRNFISLCQIFLIKVFPQGKMIKIMLCAGVGKNHSLILSQSLIMI
jgi:hypothetical protein